MTLSGYDHAQESFIVPSASDASGLTKRKRSHSRASYPRKRALTACETCRLRKTKCDNQRPICGGCASLNTECSFQAPKTDHSTYDQASLEILDRINYVAGLLEARNEQTVLAEREAPPSSTSPTNLTVISAQDHGNPELYESLEFFGRSPGVCEDVLEWPIFGQIFDRTATESLIFSPGKSSSEEAFPPTDNSHTYRKPKGINEELAPVLVERFLVNVHIKNPVVDEDELRRSARFIAENGFSWDADSCLMLIVCALGTLSSDFCSEPVTPALAQSHTSLGDAEDYATAESYYVAARKRLGLLDFTIRASQSYFLTGVYEMYSLRLVKAWGSFKRACDILQIYLRSGHEPSNHGSGSDGLVGRLYWSCLKSECEIRMEINLPASGLANAAFSDVFPNPPTASPRAARSNGYVSSENPDLERVWNYFLSEIAVRRIGNRIMNCFYQEDATAWLTMPLQRKMRIADELELQLTQWYDHLPAMLFSRDTSCSPQSAKGRVAEELRFVLQARLADFRERIYRPFLFLAVHIAGNDPSQRDLEPYVRRCIDACMTFILRGVPRHRHHGTWYENRGVFLKVLLLMAVAKSDKSEYLPEGWQDGAALCDAGFRYWEREAPDLREARNTLETLLGTL